MKILSDKELLKLHPWISPDESGDLCLACMKRTIKAQHKEVRELLDGIENPYVNVPYTARDQRVFNKAIKTMKALLEE